MPYGERQLPHKIAVHLPVARCINTGFFLNTQLSTLRAVRTGGMWEAAGAIGWQRRFILWSAILCDGRSHKSASS